MFFEKIKNNKEIIIILIVIAILVSLMSCCSLMNTTFFLSTDVSVWINIAKKIQSGKIIYKDIFDHKGPVLYFLYYCFYNLAGIKGIGILDYLCTLIDVFFIYKISRKFNLSKQKSIISVLLSMIYMVLICSETPCTESIGLPFIIISLYGFSKFMQNEKQFYIKESLYTRILSWSCFIIKTKFSSFMGNILFIYFFKINKR